MFLLPNKVFILTRSFYWEEQAYFLCCLQSVNTGVSLFIRVCFYQHFTVFSIQFHVCSVKFIPKRPIFWGLTVNGTVLILVPRVR